MYDKAYMKDCVLELTSTLSVILLKMPLDKGKGKLIVILICISLILLKFYGFSCFWPLLLFLSSFSLQCLIGTDL